MINSTASILTRYNVYVIGKWRACRLLGAHRLCNFTIPVVFNVKLTRDAQNIIASNVIVITHDY